MLECCGFVFLDKEMRNPGGTVPRNEPHWKEPPSARSNEEYGASDADGCTDHVEAAGIGLAVFRHVIRPEFSE